MIRIVFFLLMAFGLIGFGTVAWVATRPPHAQVAAAAPAPKKVTILTAAHAINAGSLLKPDDFAATSIPADPSKAVTYTLDTPEIRRELVGAMTRRALAAGDMVREGDVIRPGEHGFLAAALHPGMRAVTISVDAGTGAGELIGPGDRVDVILTQTLNDRAVPASRRVAAETVLSDVRVLAIDQKLVLGATTTPADHQNRTVTLEVTEAQAQRISVATQLGRLSLSVRAAGPQQVADNDHAARPGAPAHGKPAAHHAPGTVWAVDVSPALGVTEAGPPANGGSMRVFQGSADVKEFKF